MFGLVGSGRTQVARCIFGAEPFDAGEVRLDGKPIRPRSPREAVQGGHRPADRGPEARRLGAELHDSGQRQHGLVRAA